MQLELSVPSACTYKSFTLAAEWLHCQTAPGAAGKEQGRKRKQVGDDGLRQDLDRAQQAFAKVVNYCVAERCRRAALLEHFGERLSQPCNGCDWCLNRTRVSEQVC